MKQCPKCGNTYTNDQLVFCLEDGAKLASVSQNPTSYDRERTLRFSQEETLQADAFKHQGAQTNLQPQPPLTTPPRSAPPTLDNHATAAPTPSNRSSNPAVIAGITAIVVLLLVITGIGVALLLRDASPSRNQTMTDPNFNRSANKDSGTRNASDGGTESNSTQSNKSSNKTNANEMNRNDSKRGSAIERGEAKVLRDQPLTQSDLTELSSEELRRLRNTIYARHGRTFDTPELQRYFESRPWYKPRSDYSAADLTETDRTNISLIQARENGAY